MTRYATRWSGATPMSETTEMRSSTPLLAGLATEGPGFDQAVNAGGYRWWYVDGFSDCGRFGVTLIAFIGSVFSPYYFRARRRAPVLAEDYVSLNVILYGRGHNRWCMTERGAASLAQHAERLEIGPSDLHITDSALTIDVRERATPLGQPVEGRITVLFGQLSNECFQLDSQGCHWWWPMAPQARISLAMRQPELQWEGSGYLDSNAGDSPLESAFNSWNWCRGHKAGSGCEIHYDAQLCSGGEKRLSLRVDDQGRLFRTDTPERRRLPDGPIWRVARPACLDLDAPHRLRTLEDTPFYTRSLIETDNTRFMHESLDLTRFCKPWVQWLLPFRMPRVAGGRQANPALTAGRE
jgi:carotenoid 1,2-hydratase